jgi:3-oxoacyl-[acyl-carrier-protein] synthase II
LSFRELISGLFLKRLFCGCIVISSRPKSSSDDVLVTGVGLVTPLGNSVDVTWKRLLAGHRAGRTLTSSDIDHYEQLARIEGLRIHGAPVNSAGLRQSLNESKLLANFPPNVVNTWLSEPLVAMSLAAYIEAVAQAGLADTLKSPGWNCETRTAVVYGSSKGGLRTAERLTELMRSGVANERQSTSVATEFDSLWQHAFASDSATRAIAAVSGATAGVSCPVAACATGLISVLQGAAVIRSGLCDVCIVGSADAGLRASVMSSFHRLRVTSRHADPATACRPFDVSRDGFLIGEGAGVLILESRRHAESRGIAGLACVRGGLWLSDPTGMTQIDQSGSIVAEVLRRSFGRHDFFPDVISLHGTGTEANDLAEARGINAALGGQSPACFGVKGAMGHLLGAAGSVETILTILALREQVIPATTNLQSQDANCEISLSLTPRRMPGLQRAAKLSLGFGGHVACGLFQRERGGQ